MVTEAFWYVELMFLCKFEFFNTFIASTDGCTHDMLPVVYQHKIFW